MTTQQADISQGRKLSGIWIIPILALVLGVYMVIHNMMTEGPEIEIAFTTASGLIQGKTKIKYRNVDMGLVEEVRLNDEVDGVIATVKLDRQALPLLREDTRFWVVTARVGLSNISGPTGWSPSRPRDPASASPMSKDSSICGAGRLPLRVPWPMGKARALQ